MKASPARRVALQVVSRVRSKESWAHETLDAALSRARLDERDTAFATRLAYGTISTRGTLEEAVRRFADRPSRIEPTVADALAVAAYEILYMSTPARAAVSEGVELVRSTRPAASGFANAVLRRLAEAAPTFPWGDAESDIDVLARLHGHPVWLARQLVADFGWDRAGSIMAANNEPAPLFLAHVAGFRDFDAAMRILSDLGAQPRPCSPAGCIVAENPAAVRESGIPEDVAVVCDAGAQLVVSALHSAADARIVEIGAGRGTKTLLLAARAHSGGAEDVTAVDVHSFKLDVLATRLARLGLSVKTVVADATCLQSAPRAPRPSSADAVLLDAPCSGLGTLRRHPDRRWRIRPEEIDTLSALASALLAQAAAVVKPGGFVVYSTCTITRRENDGVVRAFLGSEAGNGFAIDSLEADVPPEWRGFLTEEGWFQSLPEIGGPDGHFVARLRRR